jgi:HlyD family secretion protein
MSDPKNLPLPVVDRGRASMGKRPWRALFRLAGVVPLVMLILLTGAVVGLYFQPPGPRLVMGWLGLQPGGGTRDPIAVPATGARPLAIAPAALPVVVGLGRVQPEGEVLVIAPPFGAGDARVASLTVKEGDRVEQGAVLAVLDSERQYRAAVEAARATVAAREAALAQTRTVTRAARDEARALLARAETSTANAARELERVETLRQRGFATDQSYDQRRTTLTEAQRDVERARATLSRYGTEDIDTQADVVLAARNRDSARADLARAEADRDKALAIAPLSGTVLTIHTQPGEKPGTQGIMTLGNIDRMNVEVEVYQTHIGRVALGAPVDITAEAFGRTLHGTVVRIGLEVVRQTLIDSSPAANTDARVVKVLVALDASSNPVARRFTGLQVTARITAGAGS